MTLRLRFDEFLPDGVPLEGASLVIGRGADCDIPLDHVRVSRYHVRLSRRGSHWFAEDLGSRNGTQINGARLVGATRLRAGDQLLVGEVQGVVETTSREPDITEAPVPNRRRPHSSSVVKPKAELPPLRRRSGAKGLIAFLLVLAGLGFAGWWALSERRPGEEIEDRNASIPSPPEQLEPEQNSPADPPIETGSAVVEDDSATGSNDASPPVAVARSSGEGETKAPPTSTKPFTPPEEPRVDVAVSDTPIVTESSPTPPPSATEMDPLERALARKDAAELARWLLYDDETHRLVAEARRVLREETVYCLERDGVLAAPGDEVLLRTIGYTCRGEDRAIFAELSFPVSIVDLRVRVRSEQNYRRGFGVRVGSSRLAPHLKTVDLEIDLLRPDAKAKRLIHVEGSTPQPSEKSLGELGLSELEVWERTFDRWRVRIASALERP